MLVAAGSSSAHCRTLPRKHASGSGHRCGLHHQQWQRHRIPPSHRPSNRQLLVRIFPFDQAWNPNVAASSIAPQLFAASLFPYLGFLFHLTRSKAAPKLTLVGFYFLLAFVFATIPAGIYAKSVYGTSLANVDWLHGGAESLLTVTNLLIVLGLRQGIREAEAGAAEPDEPASTSGVAASVSSTESEASK